MARCNAGHGCSINCPDGCGCIYWHGSGICDCWCSGDDLPARLAKGEFSEDEKISFQAHDMPIKSLASAIQVIFPKIEVEVPDSLADKRIEKIEIEEKTVHDLIEELGLKKK